MEPDDLSTEGLASRFWQVVGQAHHLPESKGEPFQINPTLSDSPAIRITIRERAFHVHTRGDIE